MCGLGFLLLCWVWPGRGPGRRRPEMPRSLAVVLSWHPSRGVCLLAELVLYGRVKWTHAPISQEEKEGREEGGGGGGGERGAGEKTTPETIHILCVSKPNQSALTLPPFVRKGKTFRLVYVSSSPSPSPGCVRSPWDSRGPEDM